MALTVEENSVECWDIYFELQVVGIPHCDTRLRQLEILHVKSGLCFSPCKKMLMEVNSPQTSRKFCIVDWFLYSQKKMCTNSLPTHSFAVFKVLNTLKSNYVTIYLY